MSVHLLATIELGPAWRLRKRQHKHPTEQLQPSTDAPAQDFLGIDFTSRPEPRCCKMSTLAPPAVPLSPAEEESDVEVGTEARGCITCMYSHATLSLSATGVSARDCTSCRSTGLTSPASTSLGG